MSRIPQIAPSPPGRLTSLVRWAMGQGALGMVVLTTLASLVQYGSILLFSRLLTPARFGDLTALLALAFLIAVPTTAAQTIVAERVAVLLAQGRTERLRYFIRHASAHVFVIGLVATGLYVLSIPVTVQLLKLEAVGPAIALAPFILLSFLAPVALGLLQGMDRFIAFGLMTLTFALSRVVFGVPLLGLTGGAGGVIAAHAIGSALVVGGTAWMLREHLLRRGTGAAVAGARRRLDPRALIAGGAFIAYALLSNLDVVLAKLFLSRDEVGYYAALTAIGKMVIFLPGAVAVIMVPNAARARHSTGSSAQVLRIAAIVVALATLAVAAPAALRPEWVVTTMFGPEYLPAAPGVLPIVCAGAGLALLNLLVIYSVAIADRRWVVLLILGVVLQCVGILLFHGSAVQIAGVQAVVTFVVLLVNELAFHPLLRTRVPLARGTA